MSYLDVIEQYGKEVSDFDVSPFESVGMLHRRSKLEKEFPIMTKHEKLKLLQYDITLLNNANEMANHISNVYDFSLSKEPHSEWWWHLDKVAIGEMIVNFSWNVQRDLAF